MKRPLRSLLALILSCVFILSACKPANAIPTEVPAADPVEEESTATVEAEEPAETVVEEEPIAEETETEEPIEEEEEPLPELVALIPACEEGSRWVSLVDGAALVCIPEGTFMMGAMPDDEAAQEDEKPLHEENVPSFWMYENEVTNSMFQLFVESTGYVTTAEELGFSNTLVEDNFEQVPGADWLHPQGPDSTVTGKENEPVINVSKMDAINYCQWANDGFLPTEPQWEKAARGTTPILYPWGNDAPTGELANFSGDPFETTADIREFEDGASPFGIYNLAGNAAEWALNPYLSNAYSTRDFFNPNTAYNVTRGGSWLSPEDELRTSDRYLISMQIDSTDFIGFRCVVEALPNPATADSETPAGNGCEMTIPAEYGALALTTSEEEIFWQYGEWIESETETQTTSSRTIWEKNETKVGFFIPGANNLLKLTYTPCQMLIGSLYPLDNGKHGSHSSVYFEFFKDVTVTKTVDGSAIFYLREGSSVTQNSDGSLTVFVPEANCSVDGASAGGNVSQMPTVEQISGSGVASIEQTDNSDGTQTLKFWLLDDEYPDGFDSWTQTLSKAMPPLTSLSSSYTESNGAYSDISFEITIPADAEVLLEEGTLTINFAP